MASSIVAPLIGGAASGIFGSKGASDQAAATREAAAMADPFRSQRGMYQGILSNLYGGMAGARGGAYDSAQGMFGGFGTTGPMGRLFDKARGMQAGQAGSLAPSTDGGGIMDFIKSSPDYQFRLAEGQRALERSSSARGMLKSGGLMRDLMSFGQGQAASAYESEINRIMTMAGATVGSPGVAGQLAAQGAAIQNRGQQQLMGGIGYGIGQLAQNWGTPSTQAGMIAGQTGYTGGASGVLSGAEWESW
jgi:hypothetical protein